MIKKINKKNSDYEFRKSNKNLKNSKKNSKNNVKNSKKTQISQEFIDWLNGIQEDEPMPLEVKNIYFILDFSQNDIALSYSGDENFLDVLDYGFYSPLEGQYFDSIILKEYSNLIFNLKKNRLKTEVYNLLFEVVKSTFNQFWFLENKNIFYGLRFKNAINIYSV